MSDMTLYDTVFLKNQTYNTVLDMLVSDKTFLFALLCTF
jgi:hypothetical protein